MTLLGSIRTWNRARLTRNQLNGLSNSTLLDLGIERGSIDVIANRVSRGQ